MTLKKKINETFGMLLIDCLFVSKKSLPFRNKYMKPHNLWTCLYFLLHVVENYVVFHLWLAVWVFFSIFMMAANISHEEKVHKGTKLRVKKKNLDCINGLKYLPFHCCLPYVLYLFLFFLYSTVAHYFIMHKDDTFFFSTVYKCWKTRSACFFI